MARVRTYTTPGVEIDLDALLAERQPKGATTVRLFGKSHAIVAPSTPAGMLQLLNLRKEAIGTQMEANGQPEELGQLVVLGANLTGVVSLLEAVVPSLREYHENLMELDFDTLGEISRRVNVEEMMGAVFKRFGIQVAGDADEKDAERSGEETLEGNLPASSETFES